jgi:hypothetical protein
MAETIVYVDTSDVREGALDELKAGMKELVEFVEANEPQLIAYNVYFSDEGTRMTVLHVHPDAASLQLHLDVARPFFAGSRTSSGSPRRRSTVSRARRR